MYQETVNFDVENLSKTELRIKYSLTYVSWRDMKSRRKTHGAIVAAEFDEFSSFLKHVGPRPGAAFTLDRLDNANPQYAPGLVEWRDKKTQNLNKSNAVYLTDSDGKTMPIATWAKSLGVSLTTLYQRRAKGWNDIEVLNGKRKKRPAILSGLPWPSDELELWESRYQKAVLEGRAKLDETRSTWLLRIAQASFNFVDEKCARECEESDTPVQAELLKKYSYWRDLLTHALAVQSAEKKRRNFIFRSGGLGAKREAELLSMFSATEKAK
jgi:hypothetical protein